MALLNSYVDCTCKINQAKKFNYLERTHLDDYANTVRIEY